MNDSDKQTIQLLTEIRDDQRQALEISRKVLEMNQQILEANPSKKAIAAMILLGVLIALLTAIYAMTRPPATIPPGYEVIEEDR